jgi:WD40 repeat protein
VSGREVYRVALTGRVLAVGFRPRGNVLVTASDDGALDFWDLRRGAGAGLFRTEDFVTGVAFAPSGDLLATSSWDSTVRVWDASSGDEVRILPHDAEVNAVRFSPLGDLLATASRDGAFLWTLDGKRQAHLAEGSSIVKVAFTSDGNQVATASVSGEVIVWTKEGTAIAHLDHESPNDLAFGPGGRYLASCGADGKVKLWDWRAERLVKTWSTGEDSVLAVAFSPEEKYLATGSSKAVEIWDLKMLDRNEPSWNLAQDGPVWDIAYTAEYIIAAGDAGVRVWKTSGGRPVEERSTYRFEDRVVSVDVRRDGHLLLTGSGDVAQLLFLRAEDAIEEACRRLQHNLTRREWQRLIVGEDYRKTCENLPIPEDTASKELVVRR